MKESGTQVLLTCDGAMDLGAILQLNGDRFMAEFHQKPAVVKSNPSRKATREPEVAQRVHSHLLAIFNFKHPQLASS